MNAVAQEFREAEPPSSFDPVASNQTGARFYIPGLDGLRVFAFLAVWIDHAAGYLPGAWDGRFHRAVLGLGRSGVPVFFVLSAFLITRILLTERERTGKIDLRAYYVRRTLRIWPLYFLVVGVGLALAHHWGESIHGSWIAFATFTANWYCGRGGDLPTPLVPAWSVSVEEQFYIIWPLALTVLSRRGLTLLCGALVPLAALCRIVVARHDHNSLMLWLATTTHMDALALGTLLALNFDRIPSVSKMFGALLSVGCVAGIFTVELLVPMIIDPPRAFGCVVYAIVPLLCATIVALAIGTRDSVLALPPLARAGKFTFGLYMWHVVVLTCVKPTGVAPLATSLLVTVLLAVATYYGIERPFLALKGRFEKIKTRTAAAS